MLHELLVRNSAVPGPSLNITGISPLEMLQSVEIAELSGRFCFGEDDSLLLQSEGENFYCVDLRPSIIFSG